MGTCLGGSRHYIYYSSIEYIAAIDGNYIKHATLNSWKIYQPPAYHGNRLVLVVLQMLQDGLQQTRGNKKKNGIKCMGKSTHEVDPKIMAIQGTLFSNKTTK